MDIAPINTALSAVQNATSPTSVTGQASIKMLSNALQSSETESAEMLKMMELSVNPNVGANFDASV